MSRAQSMCPNRNNPEEFVTATALALYPGSYNSLQDVGPRPCRLGTVEIGAVLACGVESGPDFITRTTQ